MSSLRNHEAVTDTSPFHQYARPMAMLLLDKPAQSDSFGIDAIMSAVQQIAPGYTGMIAPMTPPSGGSPDVPGSEAFLFFNMAGQALAAVMVVNARIPPEAIDLALTTAQARWRDATDPATLVQRHQAHIIVTTMNSPGNDPIPGLDASDMRAEIQHQMYMAATRQITILAAALANLTDATAIYWPNSEALRPASTLFAAAQDLMRGQWAVNLWGQFDFRKGLPTASGEETVGVFSLGMRAFIGREIEFAPSTLPVPYMANRLQGLMVYLLTHGLVMHPDETVGVSDNETIRCAFADEKHPLGAGVPLLIMSANNKVN